MHSQRWPQCRQRLRGVPLQIGACVDEHGVGCVETVRQLVSMVAQTHRVGSRLKHRDDTAGIAALTVGVPKIVLSLRSVNPSNFPMLHREWMQPWYREIVSDPRVRLVANSREGAASYASWIGVPPERIGVVLNGEIGRAHV